MADTIIRRQERQQWERLKVTEWQTRQICSFLAVGVGVWGDAKPLIAAAGELSITGEPAEEPGPRIAPQPVAAGKPDAPPSVAAGAQQPAPAPAPDIPGGSSAAGPGPRKGSYEAVLALLTPR